MSKFSRRDLLALMGLAGGAALTVGGCSEVSKAMPASENDIVSFYGANQAGIVTPQQERMHFAAFDVTTTRRDDLRELFNNWTVAAERMTRGAPVGDHNATLAAPPDDTGEADDLGASNLTLTFGFGRTLFDLHGHDRFGLAAQRPNQFIELPRFSGEELDATRSNGDICVQACADDPQVAFHAIRNLARIAQGVAVLRWSQLGFGRTASTSRAQQTPRNLLGFKDGTNNLKREEHELLAQNLWIDDGPAWLRGGSYLAVRRIRMTIEAWDRDSLGDQEHTIGRQKANGAPLGGSKEFEPINFAAATSDGPVVPANAHVRLAHHEQNHGIRLLRRGYSFTDGIDAQTGQHEAGLFFISFQNDPQRFISIQQRLAENDLLNEYIVHVASGLFVVPRGIRSGEDIGAGLV